MTSHDASHEQPTERSARVHRPSCYVTDARARAQRQKLDAAAEARQQVGEPALPAPARSKRGTKRTTPASRRASPTLERAIEDYLLAHEGGNHSPKTLEWHRTSLGFFCGVSSGAAGDYSGGNNRGVRYYGLVCPSA